MIAVEYAVAASVEVVAEPEVTYDTAFAFALLVLVSVAAAEVDSSGHPSFHVFPNICCSSSSSSSFEGSG